MKIGWYYKDPIFETYSFPPEHLPNPKSMAKFCPVVMDTLQNMFIIKCPYDLDIELVDTGNGIGFKNNPATNKFNEPFFIIILHFFWKCF